MSSKRPAPKGPPSVIRRSFPPKVEKPAEKGRSDRSPLMDGSPASYHRMSHLKGGKPLRNGSVRIASSPDGSTAASKTTTPSKHQSPVENGTVSKSSSTSPLQRNGRTNKQTEVILRRNMERLKKNIIKEALEKKKMASVHEKDRSEPVNPVSKSKDPEVSKKAQSRRTFSNLPVAKFERLRKQRHEEAAKAEHLAMEQLVMEQLVQNRTPSSAEKKSRLPVPTAQRGMLSPTSMCSTPPSSRSSVRDSSGRKSLLSSRQRGDSAETTSETKKATLRKGRTYPGLLNSRGSLQQRGKSMEQSPEHVLGENKDQRTRSESERAALASSMGSQGDARHGAATLGAATQGAMVSPLRESEGDIWERLEHSWRSEDEDANCHPPDSKLLHELKVQVEEEPVEQQGAIANERLSPEGIDGLLSPPSCTLGPSPPSITTGPGPPSDDPPAKDEPPSVAVQEPVSPKSETSQPSQMEKQDSCSTEAERSTGSKIQKLRDSNAQLAAMAKRLENKAKELQKPTRRKKRVDSSSAQKSATDHTSPESSSSHDGSSRGRDTNRLESLDHRNNNSTPTASLRRGQRVDEERSPTKQMLETPIRNRPNLNARRDSQGSAESLTSVKNHINESALKPIYEEIKRLAESLEQVARLEVEVSQQRTVCDNLEKQVSEEKGKFAQLSLQLQNALAQNSSLLKQLGELQGKLSLFEQVSAECSRLKKDLEVHKVALVKTTNERDIFKSRLGKLENEFKLMQDSIKQRLQLEREHQEALQGLRKKQDEIRRLQEEQDQAKRRHQLSVEQLEAKVNNLEKKWEEQSTSFSKISKELTSIRQDTSSQIKEIAGSLQEQNSPQIMSYQSRHDDWGRTAEETKQTRLQHSAVPRDSSRRDDQLGSSSSRRSPRQSSSYVAGKRPEDGEVESSSEPEELLEEVSDKIDDVLLSRLQPSPLSSGGPISKLAVYIAKYNYNPFVDSPNANPDSELPLKAGDYIYVYGDPDEDGFYQGELMDGKHGSVPSNFIERVADTKDLFDNKDEKILDGLHNSNSQGDDDGIGDLSFNSSDETDIKRIPPLAFTNETTSFNRSTDHPSDLEDIPEVEEEDDGKYSLRLAGESIASMGEIDSESLLQVPAPAKLTLERQLKNSIIISWVAPDTIARLEIEEFRVYVNGQFRTCTRRDAKTRALVENIRPLETYRISVRTVTKKGQSDEHSCTIMVGPDASVTPTDLKASHVTPSSAQVSWVPGNSNMAHMVFINTKEQQLLKPGIHSYSMGGLAPLSVYRIKIQAKGRKTSRDETLNTNLAAEIEFKTLPGGLPDPPLDVQAKLGPYPSTVMVEWLPVTITTSGLSNGAVVSGYAVYANEVKVAETMKPTGDHVVIQVSRLRAVKARDVIVRTLSPNGDSADSIPGRVKPQLLEERRDAAGTGKPSKSPMNDNASDEVSASRSPDTPSVRDSSRSEGDSMEKFVKKVAKTKSAESPATSSENHIPCQLKVGTKLSKETDTISDSERSELSDILEEREEEVSEFGGTHSLPGLSDSSSTGRRRRKTGDEERRRVEDNMQHPKPSEFDTDPELESLNKPGKVVPIQVIRRQQDVDRETEQSPHNQVVEPVPVKAGQKVPHIEITKEVGGNRTPTLTSPNPDHERHKSSPTSPVRVPSSQGSPKRTSSGRGSPVRSSPSRGSPSSGRRRQSSQRDDPPTHPGPPKGQPPSQRSWNGIDIHQYDDRPPVEMHRRLSRSSRGSRGSRRSSRTEDLLDDDFSGSEPESIFVDESTMRFFVALYDYDPATMSPNVDAYDEELGFREGDVLRVYGEKDDDGFFVGEFNGRRGYVPFNMIEEIDDLNGSARTPIKRLSVTDHSDSPDRIARYSDSLNTTMSSPGHIYDSPANGNQLMIPRNAVKRTMKALFDYDPRELSPNPDIEMELLFRQGDILYVYGEMDDDGFFIGELSGERGLVPSNFLEEVSDQDSAASPSSYSPSPGRELPSTDKTQSNKAQPIVTTESKQENGKAPQINHEEVRTSEIVDLTPVNPSSTPETKKKKGFLSKGKALFKKKLGHADSKQKK